MRDYSLYAKCMGVDFPSLKKKYEDEFVILLENTG
jgi:hypothetical protein